MDRSVGPGEHEVQVGGEMGDRPLDHDFVGVGQTGGGVEAEGGEEHVVHYERRVLAAWTCGVRWKQPAY